MAQFLAHWANWFWSVGIAVSAVVVGLVAHCAIFALAGRFARRSASASFDSLVRHSRTPASLILPLLTLSAALPFVPLPARILGPTGQAIGLGLIAALAWRAVAMIDLLAELINLRHTANVSNNLGARRIRTQVQVLRHTMVVIIILAVSTGLMTFPNIRHGGESFICFRVSSGPGRGVGCPLHA